MLLMGQWRLSVSNVCSYARLGFRAAVAADRQASEAVTLAFHGSDVKVEEGVECAV